MTMNITNKIVSLNNHDWAFLQQGEVTLEIEEVADKGFTVNDVSIGRKTTLGSPSFKSGSTGFEDQFRSEYLPSKER